MSEGREVMDPMPRQDAELPPRMPEAVIIARLNAELAEALEALKRAEWVTCQDRIKHDDAERTRKAERDALIGAVQCCMCGKKGLSTAEDGGPECELEDGRWVCSAECYDKSTADDTAALDRIKAEARADVVRQVLEIVKAAQWQTGAIDMDGSDVDEEIIAPIRALTPPADLAARIGGAE